MAKMSRSACLALAEKRILSILDRHGIAVSRTIEQKIADAGPNNLRVDPHLITEARRTLETAGHLRGDTPWFHLTGAPPQTVLTFFGAYNDLDQQRRPTLLQRGAAP